ncbi:MAG: hypothetical protein ACREXW_10685 [Gammaproteobacteria bacterium]
MLLPTGILVSALFGCASHQQADTSAPSASETDSASPSSPGTRIVKSRDGSFDGEIIGTPAPNSKFAKVEIGMGLREVEDLIGRADDTEGHITGKQFIPFFFGGDTHRLEAFYKNEGELTFSPAHLGGLPDVLIRITVNPEATGYR